MKHARLRAAAHNLADSLSGEISFLLGYYELPFWQAVDRAPKRHLTLDLLRGTIFPIPSETLLVEAVQSVPAMLPEFLRKNGCDVGEVVKFELHFRRLGTPERGELRNREVFATVAQKSGKETTDRFIGWPLSRMPYMDQLGRIRRAR